MLHEKTSKFQGRQNTKFVFQGRVSLTPGTQQEQ